MAKKALHRRSADDLIEAISAGDADLVTDLCPCRSNIDDVEVWRRVFDAARAGHYRVRERAAHSIATLLQKAQSSSKWQTLLRELDQDLALALQDERAHSAIMGQIQHQGGHARTLRGSPGTTLRYQKRVLNVATPDALARWVNAQLGLSRATGVSARHAGIDRLWRWMDHRVAVQRGRPVSPNDLLAKAQQWLPDYFGVKAAERAG